MKKGLLAIALLLGSSAFANHEVIVDTTSLTCQGAIAKVNRNGVKKFTVNGAGPYEFYSADAADDFAADWQRAEIAWAPTSDAGNCPVGFKIVNK